MRTLRRNLRRVRRPLLALVVLVLALAIGYGVRACDANNHAPQHTHGEQVGARVDGFAR